MTDLQLTNAVLSQGKAGTVLRHVTLGDDLTSQQHDNIQSFLMQFGKGIMPQHAWWDLDAYHDGTVQEPCKYPAPEVEKHASPMTQEEKIEVTMTQQFTVTVRAVMHQKTWKIPFGLHPMPLHMICQRYGTHPVNHRCRTESATFFHANSKIPIWITNWLCSCWTNR